MNRKFTLISELVLAYHRYSRRLRNLMAANSNVRRQRVLKKHIARILQHLESYGIFKRAAIAATVAGTAFLMSAQQAQAQTFDSKQNNPFSIAGIPASGYGGFGTPSFFDLDNDGDLDMLISDKYDAFYYFENTGTASSPSFASGVKDPFGLDWSSYGDWPNTEFVDLDGDGDADIMANEGTGDWLYFENTGTISSPAYGTPSSNPFSLPSNTYSDPGFGDIDGDGDLDMMHGNDDNTFIYYENIGTASSPNFASPATNPFNLAAEADMNYASASFADFDGDGDLDIISGSKSGDLYYHENIGTTTAPDFGSVQKNPYFLTSTGSRSYEYSAATFVDLDNDGDFDIMANNYYDGVYYYENITAPTAVQYADELKVSVSPNPVLSSVSLELPNEIIEAVTITNPTGSVVFSVNQVSNSSLSIDMESWKPGIYMATVVTRSQTKAVRLVKK